jgi:hypothetical protein
MWTVIVNNEKNFKVKSLYSAAKRKNSKVSYDKEIRIACLPNKRNLQL